MIKSSNGLRGSLSKISTDLGVQRVGSTHQAGSDSLVTVRVFFKLTNPLNMQFNLDYYRNKLFGFENSFETPKQVQTNQVFYPYNNTTQQTNQKFTPSNYSNYNMSNGTNSGANNMMYYQTFGNFPNNVQSSNFSNVMYNPYPMNFQVDSNYMTSYGQPYINERQMKF